MRHKVILIVSLLVLSMAVFSPIVSASPHSLRLSSDEDGEWDDPLNLSRSGAASEPRLVIDSDGDFHVLWREDAVNSFYYTHKESNRWSRPAALELPFSTNRYAVDEVTGEEILLEEDPDPDSLVLLYDPLLVADNESRIHAFWVDDEARLFQSSVLVSEFDIFESWTERQLLSDSVLDFSATVDSRNSIHLSFADNSDSPEMPAGIYYRGAESDGEGWSEPSMLYQSAYFRAAEPGNVNIQIVSGSAPGDTSGVHVVLDNRSLEEILYVRSGDRGATWQSPSIIDRRGLEDAESSVGPSTIAILPTNNELQLIWLAGHDSSCQQYHQWSEDGGRSWQPAAVIENDVEDCPSDYKLVGGRNDLLYIFDFFTDSGVSLKAWNGKEWSKQQRQPIVTSFDDPVTHREVDLDCQQTVVDADNNLLVIGCGSIEENQDIWLLERPLGEEADWFSSEPKTWSDPTLLMATEDRLLEPLILSGSDNLLHAFWIDEVPDENARIFYSSWNESAWSRQVPLLDLDVPKVDQLSGIIDLNDGPFLLWRDEESNAYFYSTVMNERLLLPSEWSVPQPLFEPETLINHPTPHLDINGVINIIYAMPLNEGRGIYLTRTTDFGNSWSEPVVVVDAVEGDWSMVDRPSIAQTENGDLHVVFTVYSLEPEPVAKELYHTRSVDNGETWSDAELIAQGELGWNEVVGVDAQTVLIAWEERSDDQVQLWSMQSTDGGQKWERPVIVLEPDTLLAVYSMVSQLPNRLADQPYLVHIEADADGDLTLQERRWSSNMWLATESHDLDTRLQDQYLLDLAAAVTGSGDLMTLFNTKTVVDEEQVEVNGFSVVKQLGNQQLIGPLSASDAPSSNLLYTNRSIELPELMVSSEVSESATASQPATAEEIGPAQTSDASVVEDADSVGFDLTETVAARESTSLVNKLVMGIVPVALIVVVVVAAGIINLRPRR